MIGVFIGTFISTITTSFWVEPYVLYKYGFKSSVFPYFKRYALYTIVTILTCFLTMSVTNVFKDETIINFIFQMLSCIVIPNIIFGLMFYRTEEFRYLYNLLSKFYLRRVKSH